MAVFLWLMVVVIASGVASGDVLLKEDNKSGSGIFEIVYNGKSFKLSSNEKIDNGFLSQLFNVDAKDIIGFQTQDGLLIRISNDNLTTLVDGKIVVLKVVDNNKDQTEDECKVLSSNGYNTMAENTFVIKFYSNNDNGDGALKKMNDWLRHPDHHDFTIIDIKNTFFYTSSYVYWYHVVYSK
eukprot:84431_1